MDAIYGQFGVKAGFTKGQCQKDIVAAIEGLIAEGVKVIILGCTEIPLLISGTEFMGRNGARARLIDPTSVLAQQCVKYAMEATEQSKTRNTEQAKSTTSI
jgi:aspartate racemase